MMQAHLAPYFPLGMADADYRPTADLQICAFGSLLLKWFGRRRGVVHRPPREGSIDDDSPFMII